MAGGGLAIFRRRIIAFVGGKIRLPEKIAVKAPVLGAPFDYAERPFDRLVAVRRAATL